MEWFGAIFSDEFGFFCAFEKRRMPKRCRSKLFLAGNGGEKMINQFCEISEILNDLLKNSSSGRRRERVRRRNFAFH